MEKKEKNKYAILKILEEAHRPLGSSRIAERLLARGSDVSERTIRFYLLALDRKGLTRNMGKKGRLITEQGIQDLAKEKITDKVGFFGAEIDQMALKMSFDLSRKAGTVMLNYSLLNRSDLERVYPSMQMILSVGYGMGRLLALAKEEECCGETVVPQGMIALGASCCINLNGVLLAHGIPTTPRFGGLLEFKNGRPERFVELIYYEGVTIDPLEIFIKSNMTDLTGLVQTGSGKICVSFNEVPAAARDRVIELSLRLKKVGLGNIVSIGWPGQSLIGVPVREGRVGFITACGLNIIAALVESGYQVSHHFQHAPTDYRELFNYEQLGYKLLNSQPSVGAYEKSAGL